LIKAGLIAAAASFALGGAAQAEDIYSMVAAANAQLAAEGKNYRIESAEYITAGESNEVGRTLFFSHRGNRHLGADFVPGDARRVWGDGTNITFALDNIDLTNDIAGTGELNEIRAAMATWENQTCSTIRLVDVGNTDVNVGLRQGTGLIAADITHAGFLPATFFIPLGSPNILAVTFTFVFISGGVPTDIDNNRLADAALREIYYNDGFTWEVAANDQPDDRRFDLQTVALHEAGHGLSQGHFGAVFQTGNPPKLHTAPLAVMNAGYIFGQQQLAGADVGGHCSNWASWPNN
jgi:hypothetical protein